MTRVAYDEDAPLDKPKQSKEDDVLLQNTKSLTNKSKSITDMISEVLKNTNQNVSEHAKTPHGGQPWEPPLNPEISRFAQPNLPTDVTPIGSFAQEIGMKAGRPIAEMLMRGLPSMPNFANNPINNLMKTPVRDDSGNLNPSIVDRSTDMTLNLAGGGMSRAALPGRTSTAELGMAGPGKKGPPTMFTPAMEGTVKSLVDKNAGKGVGLKNLIREFRERHPDFPGVDTTIKNKISTLSVAERGPGEFRRITPDMSNTLKTFADDLVKYGKPRVGENLKKQFIYGRNNDLIKAFRGVHPEYAGSNSYIWVKIRDMVKKNKEKLTKEGGGTELGSFGGRGGPPKPRLNTPGYGESVNWLQSQRPVDTNWVRDWAKDAGVPVKIRASEVKDPRKTTHYAYLGRGKDSATVRIPQRNAFEHLSHPEANSTSVPGNFFDTATKIGTNKKFIPFQAENLAVNKSNMSYGNPEALDAALKWRFSKAPHGQNWLIPEDMAPRIPPKPQSTPSAAYNPQQDPNQLKMILNILSKGGS